MRSFRCLAVLFDLDGVLVDSRAVIERHWARWARGRELDLAGVLALAHGRRTVETIRLVAPHLDADREAADLAAAEGPDTDGLIVMEGARELVAALPPRAWAVVTSGTRPTADTRLRHAGLPPPVVLVTADDVRRGKPDPEGYATAAARLGIGASDCVVVEDAPAGLAAARAAGMRAIGLTSQSPPAELADADVVIRSLRELRVASGRGRRPIVLHAGP